VGDDASTHRGGVDVDDGGDFPAHERNAPVGSSPLQSRIGLLGMFDKTLYMCKELGHVLLENMKIWIKGVCEAWWGPNGLCLGHAWTCLPSFGASFCKASYISAIWSPNFPRI
jgi:hypothetical protein